MPDLAKADPSTSTEPTATADPDPTSDAVTDPQPDRPAPDASAAPPRLFGLDVLRGAALVVMLLTPVTGTDGSYPHLGHAPWDGFTVADAILPTFLLAGGASLVLLLRPPVDGATRLRLVRRTIALIVLGVAYNAVGQPLDLAALRLTGVLQLIGITGGLAAVVLLATRRLTTSILPLVVVAGALLVLQGQVLAGAGPCPDGVERCSPWIGTESSVLGPGHLYAGGEAGFDPEGIGPVLGGTALVLVGAAGMEVIRRSGPRWRVLALVAASAGALIAAGLLLDDVQAINKRLHTPAFTILAAGVALGLLTLATAAFDTGLPGRVATAGRRLRRILADPFTTVGRNALVVFLAERVLLAAAAQTSVSTAAGEVPLQQALLQQWIPRWLPVEGVRVHLGYTALLLAAVLAITYLMRLLRWRVVL